MDELTVYDHYEAALDSVAYIDTYASDPEYAESVERNREHLRVVLERETWPSELDLAPLQSASVSP